MENKYRPPNPDGLQTPQDIEAAYDAFRQNMVDSATSKTRLEAAQLVGVTDESNILQTLGRLQQRLWHTLDGTPQNDSLHVAVSMAVLRAKSNHGLDEKVIIETIRNANERAAMDRTSMEWR